MVLVRSESGQLLMIPQQALAQMQAQGGITPRTPAPTNVPPVQVKSLKYAKAMFSLPIARGGTCVKYWVVGIHSMTYITLLYY